MKSNHGLFKSQTLFALLCLSLAATITACAPHSDKAGEISATSDDASIVNGTAVKSTEDIAKSTVALYITMNRGGQTRFRNFCSGTLIAPDLVMTAAHCVVDMADAVQIDMSKYLASVQVAFGTAVVRSAKDSKIQLRNLKAIKVHEEYVINSVENAETVPMHDIALLRLSSAAPAGYIPAQLPSDAKPLHAGSIVTLAGYGLTNGTLQVEAKSLNKTTVTVNNPELTWSQFSYVTQNGKSACSGDSGGPAYLPSSPKGSLVVVGVTSWGDNECREMGAYTSVGAFLDWLKKNALSL